MQYPLIAKPNPTSGLALIDEYLRVKGWAQEESGEDAGTWVLPSQYLTGIWRNRLGGGTHFHRSTAIAIQVQIDEFWESQCEARSLK